MESIINPSDGGSVTLVDKNLSNFLPIQMLGGEK
jgi:membrane protease subunit HflK